MKHKFISISIALVLALSLCLVTAVPVGAEDPATLEVSKWTEYAENPVFDEYKAYYPSVIKIDGTYYLYTSDGSKINYATSTDGISWADQGFTGVLGSHPWVIEDATGYKMYYWTGATGHVYGYGINYATSPDGSTWTDIGVVSIGTMPPTWDGNTPSGLYDWSVYYNGPGDYEAWGDDNFGWIVHSTSNDGINWAAAQLVTIDGIPTSYTRPTVVKDGATYHMFIGYQPASCLHIDGYWNSGIGHATGTNPTSFTASNENPIFTIGDGIAWRDARTYTPVVIEDGGIYKMWFTGKDGGNYAIGYATADGPFPSIQSAIDAADPGDIINVAAGTYNEHVVIDKQLTLLGANADVNPVTHLGERGDESIIDGTGLAPVPPTTAGGLVSVTGAAADGTVFDGFTVIESPYKSGGIDVWQVDNSVYENNIVSDNENTAFYIVGDGNVIRNNVISNNRHWGEVGQICLSTEVDDNIIENNAISGGGWIQIFLWNAKDGNIVQNNTVTGVGLAEYYEHHTGQTADAFGILLSAVGSGNIVRGNTIAPEEGSIGFSKAINISGARWGGSYTTLVEGNIVHHNSIGIYSGSARCLTSIKGNDVQWNEEGIKIGATEDATIEENDILNNDVGIVILYNAVNTRINHNNIVDNAIGVQNDISTAVDATSNWWGTTDGSAIAEMVSGEVDYSPCWGESYLIGTAPNIELVDHPWTWYTDDSIQDAIDAASLGDTIIVSDGTYTEDLTINIANLTLKSDTGKANTTIQLVDGVGIDIQGGASGFTLGGAEDKGFTILSGSTTTFNIQLPNAPSGVEISYNTINTTGNASQGVSVGAAGATGLTISNNTFTADEVSGCQDVPISLNGLVTSLNVTENKFTGPATIKFNWGAAIDIDKGISGGTITHNTITGFDRGIMNGTVEPVDTLLISHNDISGCGKGIMLRGNVDMATVTIEYNNLSGNTEFGLLNECTDLVTAEDNWWGTLIGSEIAEMVSDNVDYSPWLDAPSPDGEPTSLDTTTIDLAKGWNLMSLPLIPADPAIETVLDVVDVEKVAYYTGDPSGPGGGWLYYNTTEEPGTSDLTEMQDGKGYWIVMNAAGTLTIRGYELCAPPPTVPPSYNLVEGWNLIGFKSLANDTDVATYLGTVTATMERMYGYDAAAGSYTIILDNTNLVLGDGYWLAVSADGTIYP